MSTFGEQALLCSLPRAVAAAPQVLSTTLATRLPGRAQLAAARWRPFGWQGGEGGVWKPRWEWTPELVSCGSRSRGSLSLRARRTGCTLRRVWVPGLASVVPLV